MEECWLRVREVPGSIPCQGPRHTKYVIQIVPVVPLFGTQYWKGKIMALSQEIRLENNVMDSIWYRNPSKSEVIRRGWKNEWPHRTDKSRTVKRKNNNTKQKQNFELLLDGLLKRQREFIWCFIYNCILVIYYQDNVNWLLPRCYPYTKVRFWEQSCSYYTQDMC